MPSIEIIIPTYNNLDELIKCLDGFKTQTFHDFRVLVCIDGSSDNTENYLSTHAFPFAIKILMHPGHTHKGRNATRNLAIHHLDAKYLITLDSDTVPSEDFLEKHETLLSQKKCLAQGRIIYVNRKQNVWADYTQTRGKNRFQDQSELPPYYLTTGNAAMPAECFIQSGGQDPNMITYGGGDTEFAYRLHQQFALPVIYNKQAAAYSSMNKDLTGALQQMEEFGKINLPYIRKKHPEFNTLFRIDRLESQSVFYKLYRYILNDRFRAIGLFCVPRSVRFIRRKIIHFLVIQSIYRGYQSHREQL